MIESPRHWAFSRAWSRDVGLAGAAGLDWAIVCDLDEGELGRRLLDKPIGPAAYAQPDYGRIHQELRRKARYANPLPGLQLYVPDRRIATQWKSGHARYLR